jgi:homopolymeric O-antigen transport system ATP-binding protein
MSEPVITVENLSKRYIIGPPRANNDGLRHLLQDATLTPLRWLRRFGKGSNPAASNARSSTREEFWALKDVAFEVQEGQAIAIIGRNGAGKSTLLKILSRITEPTRGRICITGRVASLLEVGTGFHPELTGRENIFLNGAILGMTRLEIKQKFDEIVAFAEIEKFLNTPVKRYSSGMYVRLAFAVAAHLDPEIMVVDEVLAVGDAAFQQRCLAKMGTISKSGRTVLFVSHNIAAVSAFCTKAILIDNGSIVTSGSTESVVHTYLNRTREIASIPLAQRTDRKGSGWLRFRKVSILNERFEAVETVVSGQNISISFEYDLRDTETVNHVVVQTKFFGLFGQPLFGCLSRSSHRGSLALSRGTRLLCSIPRLPLQPGVYSFTIYCSVGDNLEDYVADAGKLTVVDGDYFGTGKLPPREAGDFIVAHSWTVMPLGELSSEYKCESEFGDHISTQPFRCIDDALSASHPWQVS